MKRFQRARISRLLPRGASSRAISPRCLTRFAMGTRKDLFPFYISLWCGPLGGPSHLLLEAGLCGSEGSRRRRMDRGGYERGGGKLEWERREEEAFLLGPLFPALWKADLGLIRSFLSPLAPPHPDEEM